MVEEEQRRRLSDVKFHIVESLILISQGDWK